MHVGLVSQFYAPESGGAFIHERDVFEGVVDLAHESRHEFTILTPPGSLYTTDGWSKGGSVRVLEAPQSSESGFHPLGKVKKGVARFIRPWMASPTQTADTPGTILDRLATQAGIDFLIFMGSHHEPSEIPYLTVVWDLQHKRQPWFPEVSENGIWEGREKKHLRTIPRASIVVTGNEAGRAEIEAFYRLPQERIRILPLPTPEFALRAGEGEAREALERHGIPPGYLFYPAQFWPHKNHTNLLLAVARMRTEYQLTVPVVFVGTDRGNIGHVRQVVDDLGLSDQVHYLGFVSEEDLITLYRNALALTFVSFFGPDNLPPLEAFALGCPVVAADVPGSAEQLGDAAILVDPKSPEQICTGIKSLLDDPDLRAELVERGHRRADAFTAHDYVRGLFTILDEFEPIRRCWGTVANRAT